MDHATQQNPQRSSDSMASMVQSSPLLDLAPELRNRIYELVLSVHNEVIIGSGYWTPPCLLGLCQQIRREALQLYYSSNIFRVALGNVYYKPKFSFSATPLLSWLRVLEPAAIQALRAIRLDDTFYYACMAQHGNDMLKKYRTSLAVDGYVMPRCKLYIEFTLIVAQNPQRNCYANKDLDRYEGDAGEGKRSRISLWLSDPMSDLMDFRKTMVVYG